MSEFPLSDEENQHLSARAAKSLLKAGATIDEELSSLYMAGYCDVYRLDDGRILAIHTDKRETGRTKSNTKISTTPRILSAKLYISRDTILRLQEWIEEEHATSMELVKQGKSTGIHVLARIPQGVEFIEHIPTLLEQLPIVLEIPPESCDLTLSSLAVIDKAVARIGGRLCLEPHILAPLVAYTGEIIRSQVGGQWETLLDEYGETWELFIVSPEGRRYNPWSLISDQLLEQRKPLIRASIQFELKHGVDRFE